MADYRWAAMRDRDAKTYHRAKLDSALIALRSRIEATDAQRLDERDLRSLEFDLDQAKAALQSFRHPERKQKPIFAEHRPKGGG